MNQNISMIVKRVCVCVCAYIATQQRRTFFDCRKKMDSGESRFLNDNQDDEAEEVRKE